MDVVVLLEDKTLKPLEKRARLADALRAGTLAVEELGARGFGDRQTGLILQAMEAVSRENPALAGLAWLHYAQPHIASPSGALKREASRVVGNLAHRFPNDMDAAVEMLLDNAEDAGTVVRWGSAYALGRIVAIPKYACGGLFHVVEQLAENEAENGVKNQYLAGLKKARTIRA